MTTARTTAATLAAVTLIGGLAALAGCASSSSSSGASRSGVAGSAILTLEDARGDRSARETLTMLNLPLPGLGGADDEPVEWSQLETRATSDWATCPVAVDSARGLALVAGEDGVTLVRTSGRIERVAHLTTNHAIASVSLAPSGLAVALSEDGSTLHVLRADADALTDEGAFPLAMALGSGAYAGNAILGPDGRLAVLDEGRSRLAMMRLARTDGVIGLETLWQKRTGEAPIAGAWTADGRTFVVAEKMLSDDYASEVEVVAASGRVSFYPANGDSPIRAMLPGRPTTLAVSPRGGRVACVFEHADASALALLAPARDDAALLDWKTLRGPAGGVTFDARGRHVLVAMPEEGALAVWGVDGTTLRDTDMLVDTGPGVSAVAIAGE